MTTVPLTGFERGYLQVERSNGGLDTEKDYEMENPKRHIANTGGQSVDGQDDSSTVLDPLQGDAPTHVASPTPERSYGSCERCDHAFDINEASLAGRMKKKAEGRKLCRPCLVEEGVIKS